jgi:ferredoxin
VSRTTTTALSVDWTACEGRGLCADLLPELLTTDPWGYPQARPDADGRTPHRPNLPGGLTAVPPALEPHARQAVRMCPRLALALAAIPPRQVTER